MALHFPTHRHIVVPGVAHNASFSGCVPELIARYLDDGPAGVADISCVDAIRWPFIVVTDAGTLP
jgi:hypothetical protein